MVGVDCYGEYTSVLQLNEDYGARVLVSNCCLFVFLLVGQKNDADRCNGCDLTGY